IHLVDSHTYSAGYGYPTVQGAIMAENGASAAEILAYMEDWFDCVEIQFAVYSLEFVRKSGRVSAAAAFAGDLIGLKPIISLTEGNSIIVEKLRGEKKIIPRLAAIAEERIVPGGEYFIVKAVLEEPVAQLAAQLTEALGYPPTGIVSGGPSITINAGVKLVGIIFKGQKRNHRE
ncbi:MAG: DegV family protein, partial [Clostridia bacterium]